MTEPNKELPKEVQEAIISLNVYHYVDVSAAKQGAEIAQSHYAPIIEAKDKQLSEKDKRIAELEAEKYRQNEKYEELARLYGKTVNDLSAANTGKELLKAERRKLMGLLKVEHSKQARQSTSYKVALHNNRLGTLEDFDRIFWENYCKENGIDLGGE